MFYFSLNMLHKVFFVFDQAPTISQIFKKRENFKKTYFTREKWSLLRITDVKINRAVD